MSKHKTSGNRLSKQNYCTFCEHRIKTVEDGAVCTYPNNFGLEAEPISEAVKTCYLLAPFDRYKNSR